MIGTCLVSAVHLYRIAQKLAAPWPEFVVVGTETVIRNIHVRETQMVFPVVPGVEHTEPLTVQVTGFLRQLTGGITVLKCCFQGFFKQETQTLTLAELFLRQALQPCIGLVYDNVAILCTNLRAIFLLVIINERLLQFLKRFIFCHKLLPIQRLRFPMQNTIFSSAFYPKTQKHLY